MKVFISYGTEPDHVLALRLQTLAMVYGITSYVPPVCTRRTAGAELIDEVKQREHLLKSDLMLAILPHGPTTGAIAEMLFAEQILVDYNTNMPLISIVPVTRAADDQWGTSFILDERDPAEIIRSISCFLKERYQGEDLRSLLGLMTIGVGLMLFEPSRPMFPVAPKVTPAESR